MWALVHENGSSTPDTISDEREAVRAHIRKILKRLPRIGKPNDNPS
jgi:predicted heme/steroid binding protein